MKRITVMIILGLSLLVFSQALSPTGKSALSPIVLTTSNPENVSVYFLDVGQGDSILVKTPLKNILIDGGPTDAGSTVLADLNAYQVTKIDLMVATHPHADHIGGLISVLQSNIQIEDIIYNGFNYTSTQTFNTWKGLALTHNLTQGVQGQIYSMSPTINFTVLSPTSPTQFGSSALNDNSLIMKLQVGNTSILFTGDAQFDTEQSMLSSGFNLHSQVLKVGHHGSNTSTSQAFLNAVNPTYAVISAGVDNTYGHPAQQTLNNLANNNVATYGTYSYGTITFSLNAANTNPTPSINPSSNPSTSSTPPTATPTQTSNPTASPTTTSTPITTPSGTTSNPTVGPKPKIPEIAYYIFIASIFTIAIAAIFLLLKTKSSST